MKGKNDLFINKHSSASIVLLCVIGEVQKGEPPTLLTVRVDGEVWILMKIHAIGAGIWVK